MNRIKYVMVMLVIMVTLGVAIGGAECVNAQATTATLNKNITCKKTTINYNVSINGWKYSIDTASQSWCTVTKTSSGISIVASKNKTASQRRATIVVKNTTQKIVIYVTQRPWNRYEYYFTYDWKNYRPWENGVRVKPADITNGFLDGVISISEKTGIKPDNLMTVMAFESHVNHTAVNSKSGATGLIQFTKSSAKWLGELPEINTPTTTEDLKNMTAKKQLNTYVYYYMYYQEKWFAQIKDLGDTYMAVFCPNAIGKSSSAVLYNISKNPTEYKNNYNLDINHDGNITKAECLTQVTSHRSSAVKTYIEELNP